MILSRPFLPDTSRRDVFGKRGFRQVLREVEGHAALSAFDGSKIFVQPESYRENGRFYMHFVFSSLLLFCKVSTLPCLSKEH